MMQLMHHLEFDIFKMAPRMVADKFLQTCGSGTLPVGMSGGFVTDQMSCLVEKHFNDTRIWINEPSMHIW